MISIHSRRALFFIIGSVFHRSQAPWLYQRLEYHCDDTNYLLWYVYVRPRSRTAHLSPARLILDSHSGNNVIIFTILLWILDNLCPVKQPAKAQKALLVPVPSDAHFQPAVSRPSHAYSSKTAQRIHHLPSLKRRYFSRVQIVVPWSSALSCP